MPEETIALTQRALHRLKVVEAVTPDRRPTQTRPKKLFHYAESGNLAAVGRARAPRDWSPSTWGSLEPAPASRHGRTAPTPTMYTDLGANPAQEKLYELHQIEDDETVRQLQSSWGSGNLRRQAARAFQWRERQGRYGELIQIDGLARCTVRGRPRCTSICSSTMPPVACCAVVCPARPRRSTWMCCDGTWNGTGVRWRSIPYCHRIFRINPVEPAIGATTTRFGRVLAGLEIEAIHARTPQANGRVERANQTLQDRLVQALRLRGLSDLESANADLPAFIADFNPRFAVTASAVGTPTGRWHTPHARWT